MTNLETMLRERLSDSRAMTGVLDINHDRVFLHFGQIGELPRITLLVRENEISIVTPADLALEWQEADAAKRRWPDARFPVTGVMVGDDLRAEGEDGPVINLPDGYTLIADAELEQVLAKLEAQDAGAVDPKDHSKADLLAMAQERGVAADDDMTKAQIADAINGAASK